MRSRHRSIDAELKHWDDIKERHEWEGLLVGNGASLTVWEGFQYESLYKKALQGIDNPLSSADKKIFRSMNTHDFERVLAALWTAGVICQALKQDIQRIHERYVNIQLALIEAVQSVHVPWSYKLEELLRKIRAALLPYGSVYSTNYDLLLYWAIMAEGTPSHKDYFWSGQDSRSFDITNTEIIGYDESRKILYLHGALHLVKLPYGSETRKLTSDKGDLLSQFGATLDAGVTPLFITEGTAQDKLASIHSSDYLSFAYEKFANHNGNLVIFGHSLSESDQHLIDAMKRWRNRIIAFSMRRQTADANNIIERKARIQRQLPEAQIFFFDAETHPLGDPELKVQQNGDSSI